MHLASVPVSGCLQVCLQSEGLAVVGHIVPAGVKVVNKLHHRQGLAACKCSTRQHTSMYHTAQQSVSKRPRLGSTQLTAISRANWTGPVATDSWHYFTCQATRIALQHSATWAQNKTSHNPAPVPCVRTLEEVKGGEVKGVCVRVLGHQLKVKVVQPVLGAAPLSHVDDEVPAVIRVCAQVAVEGEVHWCQYMAAIGTAITVTPAVVQANTSASSKSAHAWLRQCQGVVGIGATIGADWK